MTHINKIINFLEKINNNKTNKYVITGSFALYLHCSKKQITFSRIIKDLDIYTFNTKIKNIEQNNYYDEYSIKNNKFYDVFLEEPDFYIDIFSKNYLLDTIAPLKSHSTKININNKIFYISSIEHILMLKLCTTYCLRQKEINDIIFILQNFSINKNKCIELFNLSMYKNKINFDFKKLNKDRIYYLFIDTLKEIKNKYNYLYKYINLDIIPLSLLVTLLNYNKINIKKNNIDLNKILKSTIKDINNQTLEEIIKLGYIYLINNNNKLSDNQIFKIFKIILLNSEILNKYNERTLTVFLTRCRYTNNLIQNNYSYQNINELIIKRRFLKNYFKLIS